MTLCDNGLLTYHPSLHVSGGLAAPGAGWAWGPGGHGAAGLWGWREEHLGSESPALGKGALLWGLGGHMDPKARCLKALRLGRALWSKPTCRAVAPRAGLGCKSGSPSSTGAVLRAGSGLFTWSCSRLAGVGRGRRCCQHAPRMCVPLGSQDSGVQEGS